MNVFLLAAGAVVVAGGIACVSARRAAVVALGAAGLLGAAPLLAQPLPGNLLLAERIVGAVLAGELLWLGLRGRTVAGASALSWPPLVLLALAAFAAGMGAQRLVPGAGAGEALGTSLALFTVAIVAVSGRSDGIHLGLCTLLLVAATSVVRLALSGPATALEALLIAGLGVAVAGAVSLLVPRPDPVPGVAPIRTGGAASVAGGSRSGEAVAGGSPPAGLAAGGVGSAPASGGRAAALGAAGRGLSPGADREVSTPERRALSGRGGLSAGAGRGVSAGHEPSSRASDEGFGAEPPDDLEGRGRSRSRDHR